MQTVHSTYSVEIELGLTGVYVPASRGLRERNGQQLEPDEPACVEDVDINAMSLDRHERKWNAVNNQFQTTIKTINLLDGVDLKSPAVQRLLSNLLAVIDDDAVETLISEAA